MALNRYLASTLGWVLLILPLGYGGFLAWQEWVHHKSLSAVPVLGPLGSAPSTPAPEQFKPDAIASVLGLTTQRTWVHGVRQHGKDANELIALFIPGKPSAHEYFRHRRFAP